MYSHVEKCTAWVIMLSLAEESDREIDSSEFLYIISLTKCTIFSLNPLQGAAIFCRGQNLLSDLCQFLQHETCLILHQAYVFCHARQSSGHKNISDIVTRFTCLQADRTYVHLNLPYSWFTRAWHPIFLFIVVKKNNHISRVGDMEKRSLFMEKIDLPSNMAFQFPERDFGSFFPFLKWPLRTLMICQGQTFLAK